MSTKRERYLCPSQHVALWLPHFAPRNIFHGAQSIVISMPSHCTEQLEYTTERFIPTRQLSVFILVSQSKRWSPNLNWEAKWKVGPQTND